jgi:hypothetical protein
VLLLAVLAWPAASPAATDFGANLLTITPSGVAGYLSFGGSPESLWNDFLPSNGTQGTLIAPSSGVIVSYSVYNSGNTWSPVHLRIVRRSGVSNWSGGAISSPDVVPSSNVGPQTFPARVPVSTGDYIGLESTAPPPVIFSNFAQTIAGASVRFANLPANGSPVGAGTQSNDAIALAARLEPDADNDGYGDETQDCAPADPAVHAGCPTPAASTPVAPAAKKCKKKRHAAVTAKKCKKKRR